jgi:4-hydroxy-2-oxoheptanedioate aldolase
MKTRNLKTELKAGKKLLGCWAGLGSAAAVEIVAMAGFDFVVLDWEHGFVDRSNSLPLALAARAHGCGVIVRVPDHRTAEFKFALDMGVDGVIVPMVASVEEARAAVSACRYPPLGARGAAPGVIRAADYGMSAKEYVARQAEELLIILQIEHVDTIDRIGAIAQVDGVDMLFIGPSDMTASMGRLCEGTHPDAQKEIKRAEAAIVKSGKLMSSILLPGRDMAGMWAAGHSLVVPIADANLLGNAARAAVKNSGR